PPRVLAGAVVAELPFRPTFLQPVLEIVDARARAREHLAHRVELRRLRAMRRAGDRDLVVVEVVVALDEGDRLDRLGRRAQVADELWVAESLAVRRDRVHPVDRLDDVPPPHGYPDRVHRRNLRCPSCPKSKRGAASWTAP